MEKLSHICLNPLRIEFDSYELRLEFIQVIKKAIHFGFKEISIYLLFNYKDSPRDLYYRMKLANELNQKYNCRIYSFPMKYIPSDSLNRKYIGVNWTQRQLRSFQCILNSTHGIIPVKLEFFYNAFGKNIEDILSILQMPENYIINQNNPNVINDIENWNNAFNNFSKHYRKMIIHAIKNGKKNIYYRNLNPLISDFLTTHYLNESKWSFSYESS